MRTCNRDIFGLNIQTRICRGKAGTAKGQSRDRIGKGIYNPETARDNKGTASDKKRDRGIIGQMPSICVY